MTPLRLSLSDPTLPFWGGAFFTPFAKCRRKATFCRHENANAHFTSARLAAHALRPAARSARPFRARYRGRGYRAWARARSALERTDERRAYFLGRATLAPGRDAGAQARSGIGSQPAARGAVARRARIRDRRHDLAVQSGDRRRL